MANTERLEIKPDTDEKSLEQSAEELKNDGVDWFIARSPGCSRANELSFWFVGLPLFQFGCLALQQDS